MFFWPKWLPKFWFLLLNFRINLAKKMAKTLMLFLAKSYLLIVSFWDVLGQKDTQNLYYNVYCYDFGQKEVQNVDFKLL